MKKLLILVLACMVYACGDSTEVTIPNGYEPIEYDTRNWTFGEMIPVRVGDNEIFYDTRNWTFGEMIPVAVESGWYEQL